MQENPHDDKNTIPAKNTHKPTLKRSPTSICDNMQLPVCTVTGSSVQQAENTTSDRISGTSPNNGDPCLSVCESIVSHPSNFVQLTSSDSLLVSQPESGQHHSNNVLANTIQDEFMLQQLLQEKKRQIAQVQKQINQHLLKGGAHIEVKGTENVVVARDTNLDNEALIGSVVHACSTTDVKSENVDVINNERTCKKLDNQKLNDEMLLCSLECKNDNITQGFLARNEVNLDMNSNITVANTVNTNEQLQGANTDPALTVIPDVRTPTQQQSTDFVHQNIGDDDIVTPVLTKTKQVKDLYTPDTGTFISGRDSKLHDVQGVGTSPGQITEANAPIWTPLAMKSVAKRQNPISKSDNSVIFDAANSECCDYSFNFTGDSMIDNKGICSKSDENLPHGLAPCEAIKVEPTDIAPIQTYPKTPPSNRKSAFRRVAKSGLTPVVGSLSLRGNSGMKAEKRSAKNIAFHDECVLRMANGKYLQALIDDEVELYMCRLSPGDTGLSDRRDYCWDPVAFTLTFGDKMHFIPIDSHSPVTSDFITGSAFTKYSKRDI
ncbi:hypothetical protein ACF0H5_017973 [Mactra antiquata]